MCESKQSALGCLKTRGTVGKKPKVSLIPTSTIYSITGEFANISELFTIDATTGDVTFVGNTGQRAFLALAVDPVTHIMYAIHTISDVSSLYTVNKNTGVATFVATITGIIAPNDTRIVSDMAISEDGTAFFLNLDFDTNTLYLYMLNLTTGQASLISVLFSDPTFNTFMIEASIAFGPGGIPYVTISMFAEGGFITNVYRVSAGGLVFVSTITYDFPSIFPAVTGLNFDPATGQFYITVTDFGTFASVFASLNISTGAATGINGLPFGTSALTIDTTFTGVIQPQAPGVKFNMGPCC